MYRGRKQIFDWTFTLKVGDVIAVALSFPIALTLFVWAYPSQQFSVFNSVTLWNCICYGILILVFIRKFRLYSWKAFLRIGLVMRRLPLVLFTSLAAFLAIRFAVSAQPRPLIFPMAAIHLVVCYLLVVGGRYLVHLIDTKVIDGISTERIAILGWSPRLEKALASLCREMEQYHQIIGYVVDGAHPDVRPPAEKNFRELGNIKDLRQIIKDHEITFVLVEGGQVSGRALRQAAEHCSDAMVNLRMIPRSFDLWVSRLNVRILGGVPVLGVNDLVFDRFGNRFIKRAMDLAGGLFGLTISLPIMAILALLIKRESPGPVLFFQTRLGQHGRPFRIIKLRSMRLDAEEKTGAVWAVGDDPRRLKIGAFMRSWNLDELPQFWNVVRGDMSLVGPRPERPEFVKGFRDSVRYYNLRHSIKPGLTGWAAVHGFRGDTSLEDRLEYDLYYIENWSPMLDIRIMLMTLAPPKNAY
jgi:exopolysaccharide biosynthesis polyprenyl glycosylphosphotransferase